MKRWQITVARVAIVVLTAGLAAAQESVRVAERGQDLFDRYVSLLPPIAHQEFLGAHLHRTMALLENSTPERRWPVTILVYGQSITAALRRGRLEEALKAKFPYAEITFLNRSISGFSASQLVRPMLNDVYPLHPDLVIFHDMGEMLPEYERMVQNLRRFTTAEVLLCTDPFRADEDVNTPVAADASSAEVRRIAVQYGYEVADWHEEMRAYLKAHGLAPKDLLEDNVHPNNRGLEVMQGILLRHFRNNPLGQNEWLRSVRNYEAKRLPDEGASDAVVFTGEPWRFGARAAIGSDPSSALKLTFTGNRIDCVLGIIAGQNPGTASVRIDGRAPSTINELWAFTTPSAAFGADWQPAVRRVTHRQPLIPETWRIVISKLNANASHFAFAVYGSKTGFDGQGQFDGAKYKYGQWGDLLDYKGSAPYPDVFVSNSGRVVIDHRDFKISWAQSYSKKPCPEGFEATWEAVPLFTETLAAPADSDGSKVHMVTLAKGLAKGPHTVEIVPNGDGAIAVESLVVHEPALQ
ncbi:MAG: hypothetical protein U0Q18_33310 [Bryobacteraceae bacterium]